LDLIVISGLDRDRARIELDLCACFLCSVCHVFVECSTIKHPRDWSLTLELENLTRRGMKDRATDLILDDLLWQ
jgi:hypothetical protein